MSNLTDKQFEFTRMVAKLISYAYQKGYKLTFGDAYRDPRVFGIMGENKPYSYGHTYSCHKIRLAVDFNLFVKKGKRWIYSTDSNDYIPLGLYWESMGGSWGGRFQDSNHFSIEHDGRK